MTRSCSSKQHFDFVTSIDILFNDGEFLFQRSFICPLNHLHNISAITDYWPSNVRVCGFWFLPDEWQFSCKKCGEISAILSSGHLRTKTEICSAHIELQSFLEVPESVPPIFVGVSSVARQVPYFVLLINGSNCFRIICILSLYLCTLHTSTLTLHSFSFCFFGLSSRYFHSFFYWKTGFLSANKLIIWWHYNIM